MHILTRFAELHAARAAPSRVTRHAALAVLRQPSAKLLSGIERSENGVLYRVEDLEGHRWMFSER